VPPLHFLRSYSSATFRPTLVVVGNHPDWPTFFNTQLRLDHFRWHEHLFAWEIDAEAEGMLWWCISDTIGLSTVCVHCLAGDCTAAQSMLSASAMQARMFEQVRMFEVRFQWGQAQFENERAERESRAAAGRVNTSKELGRVRSPHRSRDLPSPERAAEILGIDWPTTKLRVQRAFQRAALASHPDMKNGSDDRMRRVLGAREALMELL